jgi:iron complex transport system substrate-binding protein
VRQAFLGLLVGLSLLAGCATPAAGTIPEPVEGSATPATSVPVEGPAADPRSITGPSTAVLAHREVDVIETGEQQHLPATVVSRPRSGDREVTVTDTSRIVAFDLAGSIAATVWALGLGDHLVARDISTSFPGAEDLPLVTSEGHAINAEAVMAQRPTVILTDGSMGPRDVVEQLADTGVPVIFVSNRASFAGAADLAREVGAALGLPQTGEALAQRTTTEVDQAVAAAGALNPGGDPLRMVFLYIRGNSGIYYLFGEDSGASELIRAIGGKDVAGELGWTEMQPLTDEAMVAAAPDLILVMTHGLESAGGVDALLADKPAIALTLAGQRRRLVDMADADILSFGPRSAGVVTALADAVYRG